jgi:transmembrane sensor
MRMKDHDIDPLLAKYFSGEATAEEQASVEAWIAESPTHQRHALHVQTLLEKATALRHHETFDTDKAWQKMKARIGEKKGASPKGHQRWMHPLRVAAALVLLAVAVWMLYPGKQEPSAPPFTEYTAHDASVSDTLPDGTTFTLNKGTSLRFVSEKGLRKAKLEGEAFFAIAANANEAFLVEVGDVRVRDIGTRFHVSGWAQGPTVEVLVEEGEVQLYTTSHEGIRIQAGETGYYHRSTGEFTKTSTSDPNTLAYKTGVFTFEAMPLGELVQQLNRVYAIPVGLEGDIHRCRVTVTFRNEPVEVIAEILAETLGLEMHLSPDSITLKGSACE